MDACVHLLLLFNLLIIKTTLADDKASQIDNWNEFSYKLNDGFAIPKIALGTSLGYLPNGRRIMNHSSSVTNAVQWALEAGYRHIETASIYEVEQEVGLGVRNYLQNTGRKRRDVFITTKLWNDAHEKDKVIPALKKSLAELQIDYVNLYLMHYPMAFKEDGNISLVDYLTTWQGMEEAKMINLTRSIGVSNFNLKQMQRLWQNATIKPSVLQIKVNPTLTQDELIDWCNDHGVVVMAYGAFGSILSNSEDAPPPRADHPYLQHLALKYNKNVPQILLRYLLDRNLVATPRSTFKKRIQQNIDILDFSLTSAEIKKLSAFNSNYTFKNPAEWYNHPHFPFRKENITDSPIYFIKIFNLHRS